MGVQETLVPNPAQLESPASANTNKQKRVYIPPSCQGSRDGELFSA